MVTERSRPVAVGIDGSPSALQAARWAAREAADRGTRLRLVHALAWTADHVVGLRALAAATEAAREAADVPVESGIVTGFPVSVLAGEAARARLLVLGDRGLSRIAGLLLGSVVAALASHAACPTVVVCGGRNGPRSSGPVVVGVDGTPAGDAALAFAFEAAERRRVALVAVHAWSEAMLDPVLGPWLDRDALEAEQSRVLTDRLVGWGQKFPGVEVRQSVCRAAAANALLDAAAGAQLLVVGSRGRGTLVGAVLGSVGNAVLHRSPCPVAVVRPDAVTAP